MSEPIGNIEQRIFDAFACHGGQLRIGTLYAEVQVSHRSIQKAVQRLKDAKIIERVTDAVCCAYRLIPGAARPVDERGWRKGVSRQ